MNSETAEESKWRNRRGMAWWSFRLAALQTLAILVIMFFKGPEVLSVVAQFGAIFLATYGFYAGIIMTYIGSATYSEIKLSGNDDASN